MVQKIGAGDGEQPDVPVPTGERARAFQKAMQQQAWLSTIYGANCPSADSEVEGKKGKGKARQMQQSDGPRKSIFEVGLSDILQGLTLLCKSSFGGKFECGGCLKGRRRRWQLKKQAFWDMVPPGAPEVIDLVDDDDDDDSGF